MKRSARNSWRRIGTARAPAFWLAMIGTLVIGLGAFGVDFTVVDKILIEPPPYARPNDLYFVWRDYGPMLDLERGWLGGPDVAELIGFASSTRRRSRTHGPCA